MKRKFFKLWQPPYEGLSDEELVKKAMRQDDHAFLELMKRYEGYFCQMAYRYVKTEEEMLDLIQELTYKALTTLSQLKEPKYFKTWMTRILMNLALDEIKKQELITLNDQLTSSLSYEFQMDERLDLEQALSQIRPDYEAVLKLKYFKDLSIDEIARELDLSPNTVKSHLKRGKEALGYQLKEGYKG